MLVRLCVSCFMPSRRLSPKEADSPAKRRRFAEELSLFRASFLCTGCTTLGPKMNAEDGFFEVKPWNGPDTNVYTCTFNYIVMFPEPPKWNISHIKKNLYICNNVLCRWHIAMPPNDRQFVKPTTEEVWWRLRVWLCRSIRSVSKSREGIWGIDPIGDTLQEIPTWGKGKPSSNMPYQGDMLIPWRVIF